MRKLKIIAVVLSVGIFFLGNTSLVQATNKEGTIHKNISIENIDVSGLTKEKAQEKIETFINSNSKISFSSNDKIYNLDMNDIGVVYKINESVDKAYNLDRNKNIISNIKTKIDLDLGEKLNVNIEKKIDEHKINEYIKYIKNDIKKDPIDATIKLDKDILTYGKEEYGLDLDDSKLKNIIINKINEITYDKAEIPTIVVNPKYRYDDLCKVNSILGTYETNFNPKSSNRVNNIQVSANTINNILLNPNEEFSFNSYVKTKEVTNKFKKAPVIVNGKLEPGLGGGICQVSSTLYNAALYAGLEITNVRNHSIPSTYIPKGRDATIANGDVDLRFKNNFESPIFIVQKIDGNKVVSTIYGSEEYKKEIEIVTEIVKRVPYKVKVKNSNELYKGEKALYQKGREGYTINTFRIYKDKTKELIHESYYPPMDKIIINGIKEKNNDEFKEQVV